MKNKTAEETSRAMEEVFLTLGPPTTIRTDNGKNFTSSRFTKLMQKYEIHHEKCSTNYHQANGAAEKSMDNLKRMIKKVGKKTNIQELCLN